MSNNAFSTSRLETFLKRPSGGAAEMLPVHLTVNQIDGSRSVVFEIVEIEQHTALAVVVPSKDGAVAAILRTDDSAARAAPLV